MAARRKDISTEVLATLGEAEFERREMAKQASAMIQQGQERIEELEAFIRENGLTPPAAEGFASVQVQAEPAPPAEDGPPVVDLPPPPADPEQPVSRPPRA